jgi:isopenicillin-N epimerase
MHESESADGPPRHARHWLLDPDVARLNHGAFGACPRAVLAAQEEFRLQMEREPVRFFFREREPLLDAARNALAGLLSAAPEDLVFVRNATEGVNAVLRSLRFAQGDELLVTDHAYNACRNVVEYVARASGARVVVARVPMPIAAEDEAVDAILAAASDRTRLAMLDHVTSPTALVLPIARIVHLLADRGIDTLVDGAHAPGMIPLDIERVGAAYYAGNCHKWLCCPKGAGFLHIRGDRQAAIHPAVISHGYNTIRAERGRLYEEFDWAGTVDPTPWLCLPAALRFLDGLFGGIGGLMRHNHLLASEARRVLCEALGAEPPCPETMLGAMAAVPLGREETAGANVFRCHPVQNRLLKQFGIEAPVYHWPGPPRLWVRVSAQAYNSVEQYRRLAGALCAIAAEHRGGKRP